jgi:hypothetical protein
MKSTLAPLLLALVALAAASCGKESLSYEYTENDCPTGKHEFSSKEELCAGLKDYKLNSGCAGSLRLDAWKREGCPGDFKEVNRR